MSDIKQNMWLLWWGGCRNDKTMCHCCISACVNICFLFWWHILCRLVTCEHQSSKFMWFIVIVFEELRILCSDITNGVDRSFSLPFEWCHSWHFHYSLNCVIDDVTYYVASRWHRCYLKSVYARTSFSVNEIGMNQL